MAAQADETAVQQVLDPALLLLKMLRAQEHALGPDDAAAACHGGELRA